MQFNKFRGKAFWIGVQHIGDITLLPKLDGLGLVIGNMGIAHADKGLAQFLGIGTGEFNKFKTIGARRVFICDNGFRSVVREWAHGVTFCHLKCVTLKICAEPRRFCAFCGLVMVKFTQTPHIE
jgi:hypothetical protein